MASSSAVNDILFQKHKTDVLEEQHWTSSSDLDTHLYTHMHKHMHTNTHTYHHHHHHQCEFSLTSCKYMVKPIGSLNNSGDTKVKIKDI